MMLYGERESEFYDAATFRKRVRNFKTSSNNTANAIHHTVWLIHWMNGIGCARLCSSNWIISNVFWMEKWWNAIELSDLNLCVFVYMKILLDAALNYVPTMSSRIENCLRKTRNGFKTKAFSLNDNWFHYCNFHEMGTTKFPMRNW